MIVRISRTKFLGPTSPRADYSQPPTAPKDRQAQLSLLCQTVLNGRPEDAKALAAKLMTPKPKGSAFLHAWFDGAAWPNPGGHGAYGVLVKRHGEVIYQASEYLGHGPHITNNVAEYAGVIAVLRFLLSEGVQCATVYGDSRMVVQQLNGQIKAKRGIYLPQYREARELRLKLPDVRLVWISRGQNTEADVLSKEPLRPYIGEQSTKFAEFLTL